MMTLYLITGHLDPLTCLKHCEYRHSTYIYPFTATCVVRGALLVTYAPNHMLHPMYDMSMDSP